MREIVIAGNWKMNTNPWQGVELAREVATATVIYTRAAVVICPPATHLMLVKSVVNNTHLEIGAQNVHWEASGAFTGEISADMLTYFGINWVIIGHSERRKYFGETDSTVNKRARRALDASLRPIVCIGETFEERETGQTFNVLERQIGVGLDGLVLKGVGGLVIAYEPVWAIGTGRNATPEQAQEAHAFIRSELAKRFGETAAAATVIQYGGSVTDANAAALMACPDVDGALVGGASLAADKFARIVEAAASTD